VPTAAQYNQPSDPQPGLTGNPGIQKATFSQDHPYYPKSCASCPFNKQSITSRLRSIFKNTAQQKDCYNCQFIDKGISERKQNEILAKQHIKQIKEDMHPYQGKDIQGTNFVSGKIKIIKSSFKSVFEHAK